MAPSVDRDLVVRPVLPEERQRFDATLREDHWLGAGLVGETMRYVALVDGERAALVGLGSSALCVRSLWELLCCSGSQRHRRLRYFGPGLVLCHGLAGEAAEPCRFGLAGPAPGPRVLAVCGGGAPPPEPSSGTTGNYNKRPWPVASCPRTAPPALSATRRRPRTGCAGAPAVFSATDGPTTIAGRSFSTVTLTLA
jgi:hypothetical protein